MIILIFQIYLLLNLKGIPRRGRNKSSQSIQSSSTKTPPTATYNRNLPTIEASIPTTLPVSTSAPAKQSSQSDGKGQGKFKNITTADWIGLGSNIAGGLGSYFASKRAINKMRGPADLLLLVLINLKLNIILILNLIELEKINLKLIVILILILLVVV